MDLEKERIKRLLKSKIATIQKLKNQIHNKNEKERKRNTLSDNKNSYQKSKEEQSDDNNDELEAENQNIFLKKLFIDSFINNLTKPKKLKSYSEEIIEICFALIGINSNSFSALRNILDLLCDTTVKNHFREKVEEEKENLTN
ncbi:hypothetical protein M9Y10_013025 [Tritrichomonas musculus]|uniref:MIF4G domain-containing protein n=1 Tax=Tritrichomonas musculus TaxID=1915356 RepID=A0ABR2I6S1_9EUKA